jgi:NAD(P)-dependent dehydrogenase (short-subunit alcohol dehydrogenase family)
MDHTLTLTSYVECTFSPIKEMRRADTNMKAQYSRKLHCPHSCAHSVQQGMFENKEFLQYALESIPLGRMAEPEEVAYDALFISSYLSNMITGHILTVGEGRAIK